MVNISVIIPTYNRATLVPLAIESVLRQRYAASEIIVVDDGSTDETREVLRAYGTKLRVIHQENAGLSAARNTGVHAAHSEWVGFLDDDDEFTPERLAIAAEGIRRSPSVDVHTTNAAFVSGSGETSELFQLRGRQAEPWMILERPLAWVLDGCFFAQSLIVRRAALEKCGYFRNTLYEDMDLYVRLCKNSPWIADVRPSLHLIRRGNTPAMSEDWRSRPREKCEALVRIHREALSLSGLMESEKRAILQGLATYLFEWGAVLTKEGRTAEARQLFSEARTTFQTVRSRIKALAAYYGGAPLIRLVQRSRSARGLIR